jgi:hypothetical protein
MSTPAPVNKTEATRVPIAPASPSSIWAPNPQFHSGSRTVNGWPSVTWSGQVTLDPLDSVP